MPRVSEQLSKANATSQGRTDANLANDSNNLGGIPAEDYATKQWVRDYHDGKESDLKTYVDQRDNAILNEAKEYANSQIRGQDFSGFAEIEDLQALNNNLTEQISQGLAEQKNYTDSKTQAIVDDVNANFQDVENSIGTLNDTVTDLFQSVSNGKSLIAEAITDKGVTTSATDSYSTMATNIRSIETAGDIEIDPNFVNTADGNATENDIRLGKVAYAKGQKVYGSLVPLDTSDANATSSDILSGKTAYVDGQKIYGSLIIDEGGGSGDDNPNKGVDTSDATATSADIAYGKTAYARGQKLTGTLVNTQVEEIYGIDTEGATVSNFSYALDTDPVTQEELGDNTTYYSKNLDYAVVNYPDKRYIYSHPIGENGIYIMATTSMGGESTYKKYKYTYEELGIPSNEEIIDIAFGAPGANGDSHVCYLFITTRKLINIDSDNYDIYLYIKTYHLRENGVIGQEYDSEEYVDFKHTLENNIQTSSYPRAKIIPCNLEVNKFFYVLTYYMGTNYATVTTGDIITTWQGDGQEYLGHITISEAYKQTLKNISAFSCGNLVISSDDTGIYPSTYYKANSIAADINPNDNYSFVLDSGQAILEHSNTKRLYTDGGPSNNFFSATSIEELRASGERKTIKINVPTGGVVSGAFLYKVYLMDNSIVIIYGLNTSMKIAIFDKDINELMDHEEITTSVIYDLTENDIENLKFYSDQNMTKIIVDCGNGICKQITFEVDTNNIVAVRYRNKLFYSVKEGILTATTSDVRSGKTFIGLSGTVSTGTMEVTE